MIHSQNTGPCLLRCRTKYVYSRVCVVKYAVLVVRVMFSTLSERLCRGQCPIVVLRCVVFRLEHEGGRKSVSKFVVAKITILNIKDSIRNSLPNLIHLSMHVCR